MGKDKTSGKKEHQCQQVIACNKEGGSNEQVILCRLPTIRSAARIMGNPVVIGLGKNCRQPGKLQLIGPEWFRPPLNRRMGRSVVARFVLNCRVQGQRTFPEPPPMETCISDFVFHMLELSNKRHDRHKHYIDSVFAQRCHRFHRHRMPGGEIEAASAAPARTAITPA